MPFKGTRKSQVPMRGWGRNTGSTNLSTGLTCHSAEVTSVVQRHTVNRPKGSSAHYFGQRRGTVIAPLQHDCLDCLVRECHVSFRSASLVLYARLLRHHQSANLDLIL